MPFSNNIFDGARILYIGDSSLGSKGLEIIHRYCPPERVTPLIFRKGTDSPFAVRREILRLAETGGLFSMIISFYSDLWLKTEQLKCAERYSCGHRVITNIHPGSNNYPGMGYDTLALVRKDKSHGPAWHFIDDTELDAGPVIDVLEAELHDEMTYLEHRQQNQRLSLDLLTRQMQELSAGECIAQVGNHWRETAKRNCICWKDGHYVSFPNLLRILAIVYRCCPQHPVFTDNPHADCIRKMVEANEQDAMPPGVEELVGRVLEGVL